MKANGFFPQKGKLIQILVVTASFQLLAGISSPINLGSGEPGLKIIFNTEDRFAIYADAPWTVGAEGIIGGYDKRQIEVLYDQNYGLKEIIRSRTWLDGVQQLYAFDEGVAFTCDVGQWSPDSKKWNYWPRNNQVLSINNNEILVTGDVYVLARTRYGLTSNELFLGRIGKNIYYWEPPNPRKIYYHAVGESNTENCFQLPKRIVDLFGVTKAVSKDKDIGFVVFEKSKGFFHYSRYERGLIEFSFKNSRRVKGSH